VFEKFKIEIHKQKIVSLIDGPFFQTEKDFIEIIDDRVVINVAESTDEDHLVEGLLNLAQRRFENSDIILGNLHVSLGVNASPDFGYFDLANRYWRASLCIYFFGISGYFWESGAGYPEPWLFNTRHAIELFLKGFLLYSFWLKEVQNKPFPPETRRRLQNLKEYFREPHELWGLYSKYEKILKKEIVPKWNLDLGEPPKLEKMLLSKKGKTILKEISKADEKSFRFRYPSLKKDGCDELQELDWKWDKSRISSKTGLPSTSGVFFNSIKVINAFFRLEQELKKIESYLDGIWDYISDIQDEYKALMEEWGDK